MSCRLYTQSMRWLHLERNIRPSPEGSFNPCLGQGPEGKKTLACCSTTNSNPASIPGWWRGRAVNAASIPFLFRAGKKCRTPVIQTQGSIFEQHTLISINNRIKTYLNTSRPSAGLAVRYFGSAKITATGTTALQDRHKLASYSRPGRLSQGYAARHPAQRHDLYKPGGFMGQATGR